MKSIWCWTENALNSWWCSVIAKEVHFVSCICPAYLTMRPRLSKTCPEGTCNYFDGAITDGSMKVRVVGFNPGQQKTIKQFMDS